MTTGPTDFDWDPPEDWHEITTIDAHTGGEPLRIVVDGYPPIEGDTILEKRRYAREHLDDYRTTLMWEPRGHADMYGALLTEPTTPDADFGVLFMHNDGYSTMCGHGIIALGKVAAETGLVDIHETTPEIRIETPSGVVVAEPRLVDGEAQSVAFRNVPSFVYARDRSVEISGIGEVTYDIAFGGAFYAYCRADEVGVGLEEDDYTDLVRIGRAIKEAVAEAHPIEHPDEEDLSFLYGTIFVGDAHEGSDSRNVCVFADGEIDRCPTGTGVSGRVALRADDGILAPGERFTVESIVGSTFTGWYEEEATCGEHDAVIPVVEGSAHVTGRNRFVIDPADPFGEGFFLR